MAIRNHSIAISSAGFCRVDREGRVGKSLSPWTYRIWMGDRCLGGPGALRRTERPTPIRTAQDYGRCPCSEYEIPFTIRRCMTRASTSATSINAINHNTHRHRGDFDYAEQHGQCQSGEDKQGNQAHPVMGRCFSSLLGDVTLTARAHNISG